MSRRGRSAPKASTLDQAFPNIDTIEKRVITNSVPTDYTHDDIIKWLVPDEHADLLRATFPFIREVDRTPYWAFSMELDGIKTTLTIAMAAKGILVPHKVARHPERGDAIMVAIRKAFRLHLEFEKVREVVRWLNNFATVGASRHYCPWLAGILPAEHPFHKVSGQQYQEPRISMFGIAGPMRECGAIVAGALLCPEPPSGLPTFVVTFVGQRDGKFYVSENFRLLRG